MTGDGMVVAARPGPVRPDGSAVLIIGFTAVTAVALDGLAVVWALATLLSTSCGEDLSWQGLAAAALVASATAAVGVVEGLWWWSRHRPPRHWGMVRRALVAATVASLALATVAVFWLPDGTCL